MKALFPVVLLLVFALSSCSRTECKDCTKLFDTALTSSELDSIAQTLNNPQSADSLYYTSWDEFVSLNISTENHGLNEALEVCSKYGFMVSTDPLGDLEEERIVWYSNGSTDSTQAQEELIELGVLYFDCQ